MSVNGVAAGEIGSDQQLCFEGDPELIESVTNGTGTGVTYRWEEKAGLGDWTLIDGATSSSYDPPVISETTQYRRVTISTFDGITCEAISNEVTVQTPSELNGTVSKTDITCNGAGDGTITITNPTGGYGTYDYSIDGGTSFQPSGSFTGLSTDTYVVMIRDADLTGCAPTTLDGALEIEEPAIITASGQVTSDYNGSQVSCNGSTDGTITVTASGGTSPLSYTLSGGPLCQQ